MTKQPFRTAYDAVIVGARCAGAATAMLLALAGFRVLVVDKSRYGADTVSTHALMRPAVLLLHRWGLLDKLEEAGTPAIRTTSFHYSDDDSSESVSVAIKPRHGVDALYAPRRTVLDPLLVDAAREAGVEVRHGVRLVDLLGSAEDGVRGVVVQDQAGRTRQITANIVIGADGRNSSVARLVGAAPYVTGRYCSTSVYGYFENLPTDGNRWYYRPGTGAGVIPTNHDQSCVFVSVTRDTLQRSARDVRKAFSKAVSESAPDVAEALSEARLVGKLHSFPGMPGFLRQPWGNGWALVGDAGYMTDPITAHGITNALRDADLLAKTIIEGGDLETYQRTRDDLSRTFFEVSDRISSFDWDIPTVQQYHRIMSEEMGREEELLVQLEAESPVAA